MLYDSGRIVHYDDMADGLPVGDRGLIDLSTIRTVEKVVGVPTFVMKGTSKVYLFKLEPHDEVMMRTWIAAISQSSRRRGDDGGRSPGRGECRAFAWVGGNMAGRRAP